MASHIGRRKFLATLGGAAASWPLATRAQQAGKIPRVGYIRPGTQDNDAYREEIAPSSPQQSDGAPPCHS